MTNETLTGNWTLDPSHSEAGFTVRHAGISKVRGKFTGLESTVANDGAETVVAATIKADTFDSGNADRDGHIKSADFLDVEQFPTLDFKGELKDHELVGDLTIHGVTRPVTFDVELSDAVVDPFGNTRVGAEAITKISRKDFGLTWNAVLEGGNLLVSDAVNIVLDLSYIKDAS